MSADLYEYEDENGVSFFIEMNVHGTLFIHTDDGSALACSTVAFNSKSTDKVEELIRALKSWVEHVKETS